MAWISAAVVMAWPDSASTRAAASRALSLFGLASLGALWVLADVVGSVACLSAGLSASGGAGWGGRRLGGRRLGRGGERRLGRSRGCRCRFGRALRLGGCRGLDLGCLRRRRGFLALAGLG